MTTGPLRHHYGFSTDLFVSRKDGDHTLVLGGIGQEEERWVHVMTQRAAQVLWFKLTALLYPDKSEIVTGLATTAPLRAPTSMTVTTHVEVVRSSEAEYTLVGWVQRMTWMVKLTETETRQLWASLDLALYPVGWEGRQLRTDKMN
jgi:hypothetical protein